MMSVHDDLLFIFGGFLRHLEIDRSLYIHKTGRLRFHTLPSLLSNDGEVGERRSDSRDEHFQNISVPLSVSSDGIGRNNFDQENEALLMLESNTLYFDLPLPFESNQMPKTPSAEGLAHEDEREDEHSDISFTSAADNLFSPLRQDSMESTYAHPESLELEENFHSNHRPNQQDVTLARATAVLATAEQSKNGATDSIAAAVYDLSGLQQPNPHTANIKRNGPLLDFLRKECTEAMKKSNYKFDTNPIQDTHWTTGNDPTIAYQARIDSGAFGVVFQVIQDFWFSLFFRSLMRNRCAIRRIQRCDHFCVLNC
jgi:hypothetical protein